MFNALFFIYCIPFIFRLHISNQKNVKSGVTALSSTSSSFGTVATNGRFDTNGIDEHLKQQALAEEEAAMNQFKVMYLLYMFDNFSYF